MDELLETVSTDDLLDELMSRFEHACFAGLKTPNNGQPYTHRKWVGNTFAAAGLATLLATGIVSHYDAAARPVNEDDESAEGIDDDED